MDDDDDVNKDTRSSQRTKVSKSKSTLSCSQNSDCEESRALKLAGLTTNHIWDSNDNSKSTANLFNARTRTVSRIVIS